MKKDAQIEGSGTSLGARCTDRLVDLLSVLKREHGRQHAFDGGNPRLETTAVHGNLLPGPLAFQVIRAVHLDELVAHRKADLC